MLCVPQFQIQTITILQVFLPLHLSFKAHLYGYVGSYPICSKSSFKYYVSFLDDFSRYIWLYPISCKGDVTSIFHKFKIYVECFFKEKLRAIQSDWGGEYRPFHKLLQSFSISHRVSCPHTHQQNDKIERKH